LHCKLNNKSKTIKGEEHNNCIWLAPL